MPSNGRFACFSASLFLPPPVRLNSIRHETPDPELVLTIIERREEWRREKGGGGKMREKETAKTRKGIHLHAPVFFLLQLLFSMEEKEPENWVVKDDIVTTLKSSLSHTVVCLLVPPSCHKGEK